LQPLVITVDKQYLELMRGPAEAFEQLQMARPPMRKQALTAMALASPATLCSSAGTSDRGRL
jgi:hypothetical protein